MLEIPDLASTSLQLKIPLAIALTVTREITNVLKKISIHWKLAQKYYAKCSLQFIPPPHLPKIDFVVIFAELTLTKFKIFFSMHISTKWYISLNHSTAEFNFIQELKIHTSLFFNRKLNTISTTFYSYTLYNV